MLANSKYIGDTYVRCTICSSDFNISHGGRNDVTTHVRGKHHTDMARATSSTRSLGSHFRPQTSQGVIEAEALWSLFVINTNFLFSQVIMQQNYSTTCFPILKLLRNFLWATKTAAIIKHALAPHYHEKAVRDMSTFFSVLMDESNDKTDKFCIILVRVLDLEVGDIHTTFFDMPVVNIGTAQNLFVARLKESLSRNGLDFSKCIAFMSDITNVIKGVRSGVQRLIRNECPHVLDVGCICHLATSLSKLVLEHFLLI